MRAETLRFRHSSTVSLGEYPSKKRIILYRGIRFSTIICSRRGRTISPMRGDSADSLLVLRLGKPSLDLEKHFLKHL